MTQTRTSTLAILAPVKSWGGIEGKIVTLCSEFLRRGVQPELVCIRGGEVPYPGRLDPRVRVTHLATRSKRDGIGAVIRHLRATRPAAVLTVKDHAAQVALLARLIGRLDMPVYVKVTNTLSVVARRRAQRFMIRRLYPRADRIIANSSGVLKDLQTAFGIRPERLALIYNPTVTEDCAERARAPVDHAWLDDAADVPVILGIGRLAWQKDFPLLLRAFAQLRRERRCRLLIIGEGEDRPALEAEVRRLGIGEDVDLPGFVDDALPYLARADLFVLSSRYEGLSNVLIEALAVGTPVVATDCPSGSAEILDDGGYGPLVPVGDSRGLARAMAGQLDDPVDAQRMAEAVRRFRAGPVAERYLEVMGFGRRCADAS